MDHKAGMFTYALAFLLGVLLLQQFSVLPDSRLLLALLLLYAGLYFFISRHVCAAYALKDGHHLKSYAALINTHILLIIIGIIYASYYADAQLNYRLHERFTGKDIVVTGSIDGIPLSADKNQRLLFNVDSFSVLPDQGETTTAEKKSDRTKFPEKLRLTWYYGRPVKAGEQWQFQVRLKPPHGFMNPGGFDYEGWLFQQGIHATGYVRKSVLNQRLQTAPAYSIDHIRESISERIDALVSVSAGDSAVNHDSPLSLVKALAIGDKSSLSATQWQVLSATGTSHLMAISGLHIGLAAFFAYVLVRRILPASVMRHFPAQHIALVGGMLMALLYALIAGLSIPTQRALSMLLVLSLMMLIRRNCRPVDSLGLALLVILLFDPAAVLSAGFWFSFAAVAVIYLSLIPAAKAQNGQKPVHHRLLIILRKWIRLQFIISIFLLPLSLFMFQQVSLVSPLANLILIPYVSFLVVPVVLFAIVCSFVHVAIAQPLFMLAANLLDLVWPLLRLLAQQPYALWVQGDVDILQVLQSTSAIILIFFSTALSRNITGRLSGSNLASRAEAISWFLRIAGAALFFPLFVANQQVIDPGNYRLTILDVGQGSAAVIQTQNHALVFDSGARFSEKMDVGSSVVIPFLRSQGITSPDRLIISHGDSDHIGGAWAIITEYPETELIGQDINSMLNEHLLMPATACYAGDRWYWDGVLFEFISPQQNNSALLQSKKRNNRSCVLQISSAAGSVLLTGDIEKLVEEQLLETYGSRLAADVLVVPHHGSNTSSSTRFIKMVNPEISIISAGYKNRYKLPSKKVLDRYRASGSRLMHTDSSGAITVDFSAAEVMQVERYRELAGKYWHHKLN